nr:integrase, catalytic region, zinc finger, CCHC-type, peptidase aspartic, catalytic [Tanacetum cinerariifolium]
LKSAEVSDLNASLQENVLVITALKEQLNKLKGKAVITEAVSLNPIDPELLKVDIAPLALKLHKNMTAHTDYIRHTQEEAATLREIVESERLLNPLNTSLDYAYEVDLLTGSRGNNLYTLSLQDMMASSPICLLSKASKTKSWLWHRRGCGNRVFYPKFDPLFAFDMERHHMSFCITNYPTYHFFHVFGALCYPTNDSDNLGKLKPKADIGIFIGYAPTKKAFRIYNRRSIRIVETIHVDFDELTSMASEQTRSGPALNEMTPGTISSGLVLKYSPSTSYVPPSRNDWDLLFQPMFDELLNPPPSVDHQAAKVIASITDVIPPVHADLTGSPSSTTVDQDAHSPSKSHTITEIQSSVIPQDVEDDNLDMEVAHMRNDPLFGLPIPEVTSVESSSTASPQSIVQTNHPISHHNSK